MGILMSIFCPGVGELWGVVDGEPVGICIPGMFCMSVFCGDAEGVGVEVAAGICMPGMFSICCVEDGAWDDMGAGFLMFMPGMAPMSLFGWEGVGVRECEGMFMPFMFMPPMSCFFGAGRALFFRRVAVLVFATAFRLDLGFAFGLDMFMPGMSCMLCP
jgi:hypothetical protein